MLTNSSFFVFFILFPWYNITFLKYIARVLFGLSKHIGNFRIQKNIIPHNICRSKLQHHDDVPCVC